jgi:hypothetical protein
MNLLEGLASLEEGSSDEEIRAELAAQGIDMDAWADELQAKAEAQLRAEEEKRQERARKKKRKALIGGGISVMLAVGAAFVMRGVVMRGVWGPPPIADRPKPTHFSRGPDQQQSPPLVDTAEPKDAGPGGPPGKR